MRDNTRRELLASLGCIGTACVAGCSRVESDRQSTPTNTDGQGSTTTPPATRTEQEPLPSQWRDSVFSDTVESVVGVGTQRDHLVDGTGWVIDDTYVVTNAHVVRGKPDLAVWVTNDGWHDATVVEVDSRSDIAVIDVATQQSLPALSISTSPPVVGEPIVGIGFPGSMHDVYASGVVTGADGVIQPPNILSIGGYLKSNATQGPGSSGSPLLSPDGTVVGMVTYGEDYTVFASPQQVLRPVTDALVSGTKYHHGLLNAHVRTATYQETQRALPTVNHGVTIVEMAPNSPLSDPAETAGRALSVGDVIFEVDGNPVRRRAQYRKQIDLFTQPDTDVSVAAYSPQADSSQTLTVRSLSETY